MRYHAPWESLHATSFMLPLRLPFMHGKPYYLHVVAGCTGLNMIYLIRLIERAHLATAKRTTRRHSPLYRFNIALLSPYIGIFVLMVRHMRHSS